MNGIRQPIKRDGGYGCAQTRADKGSYPCTRDQHGADGATA
jgi:hypothetical protein